jgi:hypothetical protein
MPPAKKRPVQRAQELEDDPDGDEDESDREQDRELVDDDPDDEKDHSENDHGGLLERFEQRALLVPAVGAD